MAAVALVEQNNLSSSQSTKISCRLCALNKICFPGQIQCKVSSSIEEIIIRHYPKKKNENWFVKGDKANSLIAVRSGAIKTYSLSEEGSEQICDFHLPGELVGLDAIAGGVHGNYAANVEDSSVCEIPLDRLQEISKEEGSLSWELAKLISGHLEIKQRQINLLTRKNAEERVAAFLCDYSDRLIKRGYSGSSIKLNMSRSDLAQYLGLTLETTSRIFSRLSKEGLISVNGKQVGFLNLQALKNKIKTIDL